MTREYSQVAVTGATGFIGTHLCTELLRHGYRVRALVRDPGRAQALRSAGVELVPGGLTDREALTRLLDDCDYLVHCAGAVRGASQQDFDAVNVAGTAALLDAVLAGDRRPGILMLSSLAAREPDLSWYAASKHRGEALLAEQGESLRWMVLRPPAVYGPGDKEMLPVFEAMARGLAPVPGATSNRTSLLHVRDLVTAMLASLAQEQLPNRSFYLHDGHSGGYDWTELAGMAGEVWQRRVRLLQIPALLLDAVAAINLASARLLRYAPMLTPPKLRELRHPDWVVDNAELQETIDWQPCVDLRTGLTEIRDLAL